MSNNILKQIKLICRTYDIRPQKQKGQNFLINQAVIKEIVGVANLKKTDVVLEVGPGLGILTEELVKHVKKVISVELDKKLFDFLKVKFSGAKNLELVYDDILKFQVPSFKFQVYKVVANLPYNITSHFLKKFLTTENRPTEMTLLIQKEVAERICAKPSAMSLLSVSVQLYGQPEIIEIVKKENFWPQPKIDSAILKISSIKAQKEVDKYFEGITEKFFWQIVRVGYSARRKQLQNNLASGLKISAQEIKKILKQANFDPKIRAQNLSVGDWIRLAKKVSFYLN